MKILGRTGSKSSSIATDTNALAQAVSDAGMVRLVQWREETNDWKDAWMRTWIARQEPWDMYNGTAECLTEVSGRGSF